MKTTALAFGAFMLGTVPVFAAPQPTVDPALNAQLEKYDPRAVAAARHYFQSPAMRAGLDSMVDNIDKAMVGVIRKQNPNLRPEQLTRVQTIVGDALKQRLPLLIEMDMIAALDTFTTDEMVALDHFYSSAVGAAIVTKMPKLMSVLPAMIQRIMPDYMADVKARLQASDGEIKL